MNFNIKQSFLIIALLGLFACKNKSGKTFEVSGTIANVDKLASDFPNAVKNGRFIVFLKEIPFGDDNSPVELDSAEFPASGNATFHFKAPLKAQAMYDVEIADGPALPVIDDNNNIEVQIDFADKNKFYTVKGSPASSKLHDFIFEYGERSNSINASLNKLDSLKRFGATDSVLIAATTEKNERIQSLNKYVKEYVENESHPIVAAFALGRAAQTLQQADFEELLGQMAKKFPADPTVTALKSQFENFKNAQASARNEQASRSWVGKKAPDLILPDVNGKNVSLSSFRGKYVLVDFWASWCGPCRAENPNVVYAFSQFKNKNFTILGVSIDRQRDAWIKAIEDDHLGWTQVSDLGFWDSKAVTTFKFDGIPFNVLIDPQGTVVAESLRGDALTGKLTDLLK